MKNIINFGDIHFSGINKWELEAGDYFLDWLEKNDFGPKEDVECTFAGDITHKDVNPGKVVDQVHRLVEICKKKFKHTYICIGNHDIKMYHDDVQHSLWFARNMEGITVVEKESEIVSENGFNLLILPHQRLEGGDLHSYYNKYIETLKDKHYNIVIGHWYIKSGKEGWKADGVDISKINADCFSIGHVHTREQKEYIGSIRPCNVKEQYSPFKRCYKMFNENKQVIEMPLPEFMKFDTITFGDEVPEQPKNCPVIYTVIGAGSEIAAHEKYPTINIRGIEKKQATSLDNIQSDIDADISMTDMKAVFDKFLKETNTVITRKSYALAASLLQDESKND